MRIQGFVVLGLAAALAAGCSATYRSNPRMTYVHGANVPAEYFRVVRAVPGEISFEINIDFKAEKMYHLILDGNTPVAQGWFNTKLAGGVTYTLTMKPEAGRVFEPGKTYRLCIGVQSPEAVQMETSNYTCKAEYVFVFPGQD